MEPITLAAGVTMLASVLGLLVSFGTLEERRARPTVELRVLQENYKNIREDISNLNERMDRLEQKLDKLFNHPNC